MKKNVPAASSMNDSGQNSKKARSKQRERPVTIRDVAREAGASVSTVSAALNGTDYVSQEMRGKIQKAIARLRYRPNDLARSLRMRKSQTLAAIVPDLSNNFFTDVLRGMEDVAVSHGYTLLIGDSREKWNEEKKYLDIFGRRRVEGIVRIPAMDDPGGQTENLLGNIPVVYLDRRPSNKDSCLAFVGLDNIQAAHDATKYLQSLGHRRIALITGPKTTRSAADRAEGYRMAMRAMRMPVREELIHYASFDISSGTRAASEMLTWLERPTAIFCTNNTLTIGALEAIHDLGLRCPEEISLLGFDDAYWASLVRPRLTMVRQPAREIGITATRILLDHIGHQSNPASEILLSTQLVIRESCATPAPSRTSAKRRKAG
jgi:LacI family transcriptional regulator